MKKWQSFALAALISLTSMCKQAEKHSKDAANNLHHIEVAYEESENLMDKAVHHLKKAEKHLSKSNPDKNDLKDAEHHIEKARIYIKKFEEESKKTFDEKEQKLAKEAHKLIDQFENQLKILTANLLRGNIS